MLLSLLLIITVRVSKRGASPSFYFLPLSNIKYSEYRGYTCLRGG